MHGESRYGEGVNQENGGPSSQNSTRSQNAARRARLLPFPSGESGVASASSSPRVPAGKLRHQYDSSGTGKEGRRLGPGTAANNDPWGRQRAREGACTSKRPTPRTGWTARRRLGAWALRPGAAGGWAKGQDFPSQFNFLIPAPPAAAVAEKELDTHRPPYRPSRSGSCSPLWAGAMGAPRRPGHEDGGGGSGAAARARSVPLCGPSLHPRNEGDPALARGRVQPRDLGPTPASPPHPPRSSQWGFPDTGRIATLVRMVGGSG